MQKVDFEGGSKGDGYTFAQRGYSWNGAISTAPCKRFKDSSPDVTVNRSIHAEKRDLDSIKLT